MDVLSRSTEETQRLVGSIAQKLKPGDVLALYGDLGSGKTTFTTFLVGALGIEKRVQSPTFVILREYSGGNGKINKVNHLDLYRMQSEDDLVDLDLPSLFDGRDAITVIEWPELAEKYLPKDTIKLNFNYVSENERKISVQNLN